MKTTEISNNVILWVGSCVAILVTLVMRETLLRIDIYLWRMR